MAGRKGILYTASSVLRDVNFKSKINWRFAAVYLLPLVMYCAWVIPLGISQRELMNADAINYIRRAQYLLHGQFYYFLSEHWSLMISWLIAPLIAVGMN